jgi:NAD+ synthase (glutamine-hydrolysing)
MNLRVSAISLNQTALDWQGNFQRISDSLDEARSQGSQLILFPEMALCGYGCEDVLLADHLYERCEQLVADLLPLTQGLVCCIGLPIKFQGLNYNATLVIADTKIQGFYCKKQLANDGLHYEHRWFEPWPARTQASITFLGAEYPLGDLSFDLNGLRCGFEICQDAWVDTRYDGLLSENNVDLILNPSASHFALRKQFARRQLIIDGSNHFNCHYLYANLNGNESGRVIYDGAVMLAKEGELIYESERLDLNPWRVHSFDLNFEPKEKIDSDCLIKAENFDFSIQGRAGLTQYPSPKDLSEHEEFLLAETLGLYNYMRKCWSKGFILSLSGGVDSAVCATLVDFMAQRLWNELGAETVKKNLFYIAGIESIDSARALTQKLLMCVYQASINSGPVTQNAAEELSREIHAEYRFFDIEPLLEAYRGLAAGALGRELSWEKDDLALQNIQARGRAPGVWMLANLSGSLLLTTSNRSEAAVGYATMDGDTCGGLSPLAGIGKVYLREWLRVVETQSLCGVEPIAALAYVNKQEPTAELRPPGEEQKDEEDLMPYEILDQIQKLAIRDRMSPRQIFDVLIQKHSKKQSFAWLERFFVLWSRNQWKRERYAPAFHLDDESLDPKTWCRFPILSGSFKVELAEIEILLTQ